MTRHALREKQLARREVGGLPAAAHPVVPALGPMQQVLEHLSSAVANGSVGQTVLDALEQVLREVVPVRAARFRQMPASYRARLVAPVRMPDTIVLEVPSADPSCPSVLEVGVERGVVLTPDQMTLVGMAAHLGAVVLHAEHARPRHVRAHRDGAAPLIGSSREMRELRERIERVALTDFTVLVEGESGTGKELVARHLHELSRRRAGPFVAVNCAALVETLLEAELFGIEERTATGVRGRRGKFEHADRGTLFLDEVSDLSSTAQAKLLRAIQELAVEPVGGHGTRRVNVRIIAASNRPLSELVRQGLFRADLFYRLSGVEVHVPPLRSRPGDVMELARYFLARHRHAGELGLSEASADALRLYEWPGNVRELERFMEGAVALSSGRQIEVDDLPPQVRGGYAELIRPSIERSDTLRSWASRYVRVVYERCGGNKRRACRVLNISYHTLDAYLRFLDRRTTGRRAMPAWVHAPRGDDHACPPDASVPTA